jgi:hypothetical protein
MCCARCTFFFRAGGTVSANARGTVFVCAQGILPLRFALRALQSFCELLMTAATATISIKRAASPHHHHHRFLALTSPEFALCVRAPAGDSHLRRTFRVALRSI